MEPEPDALASAEDTRSWIYRELGGLFHEVPGQLGFAGAEAPDYPRTQAALRDLCRVFAAEPRVALEAELVRLCVNAPGGVPAPPYASWYLDGALLGPSREWAAEQYRRQGLAAAADAGQPADFIAVEFEYLYFLCRHQRAARLTGDAAALASASRAEAEFFRQHLSRWLPLFARDLAAAAAPAGAFARAGEALAAFCAEETGRLRRLG